MYTHTHLSISTCWLLIGGLDEVTKSGEVIFSHYFNYQAKRSNQPHNDGCRAKEGERGREIQGRKKARERVRERM